MLRERMELNLLTRLACTLSSLIGERLVGNWRERGAIGAVGNVGLPLPDGVVGLGNGVVRKAARFGDFVTEFEKGVVGN